MPAGVIGAAVVIGIQIGAVYSIVALGLSLIFGIVRVINFAHGSVLMLFMYLGYFLWLWFGIDPYLGILICVPAAFGFGYAVQYAFVKPMFLRERTYVVEPLSVLMLMAGFDMVLANCALLGFGPFVKLVNVDYSSIVFRMGFISLNLPRLLIIPIVFSLTFGVNRLLNRTELGNTIRAVGQNREASAVCGLNVHHIYALTFAIGCAITALGGCVMLPFYPILPNMGLGLAIKAFITVVLGGMGSIPGMLAAGMMLGTIESVVGLFMPANLTLIISLALFLLVIFFRPRGIMGRIEV